MSGPVFDAIGHHARDFLDDGLDFLRDIFHKDDFPVLNKQLFPSTAPFLNKQPHEDHNKFIFQTTYRAYDRDKNSMSFLQRGSYLADVATKLPLSTYGIIFKNPFKMIWHERVDQR